MSARLNQRNGQEGIKSVVGPMARSVKDVVLAMRAWVCKIKIANAVPQNVVCNYQLCALYTRL